MKIRVGSRKSDLAQIQSRIVADELKKVQPGLEIEFVFKDVAVDLNLNISLVEAESKGLFTKDLSMDLIAGKIDLVVHSWKDLPTSGPAETEVAATLEREDPRDVVFFKRSSLAGKDALRILSSSPRRELNLGSFLREVVFPRQNLEFVSIRGNLPTRMKKFMEDPGADGLVLALAAVHRLQAHGNAESQAALRELFSIAELCVIPILDNPPAPAQGALAIEIKRDRGDIKNLVEKINHRTTMSDVVAERERLKDFGGGCHLALGIFQRTSARGCLRVERGHTPEGKKLHLEEWRGAQAPNQVPREKFFDASSLSLFERREIPLIESISEPALLVVSKAPALPQNFRQNGQILWVAGSETWKKLRERGLWVSGSFEGLGETFLPIPKLWPKLATKKLTHKGAAQFGDLATYELVSLPSPNLPDFSKYELVYWPSGSSFLRCLELVPELKSLRHACGLGRSFEEIGQHVPADRLFCVLRREDCLRPA